MGIFLYPNDGGTCLCYYHLHDDAELLNGCSTQRKNKNIKDPIGGKKEVTMYIDMLVKKINFANENDLYAKITKHLTIDDYSSKIMRLKSLKLIDNNNALLIAEEDTSKILVTFELMDIEESNKAIFPDGMSEDSVIMEIDEIKLLKKLGHIYISDTLYEITDIRFELNSCGVRKANITIEPTQE